MEVRGLVWLYNRTPLPAVNRGQSSNHDVYQERYAGNSGEDNETWKSVLHFKRAQPSSAGNYTCGVNYNGRYTFQTVEIRVSGE